MQFMERTNRVRYRIISKAVNTFRLYGIKYTRMDLIASELHISKRTLYECFPSKEALLFHCIIFELEKMKQCFSELETDSATYLELIVRMDNMFLTQASSFCAAFYEDLRVKRGAAKVIDEKVRSWANSSFLNIFKNAIGEGSLIANANSQFVLTFLENNIQSCCTRGQPLDDKTKKLHRYTTLTYLNGICTDYGRSIIKVLENEDNNESYIKN